MDYRAVQLGIKGEMAENYINKWIINIEDITPIVRKLKKMRDEGRNIKECLPVETELQIKDSTVIKRLRIDMQ